MERMITPTTEEEWPRRDDHLGQDLKRVRRVRVYNTRKITGWKGTCIRVRYEM